MASPATAATHRHIARVVKAQRAMDGAGVRIFRSIGAMGIRVDPFLMCDQLIERQPAGSDAKQLPGFPSHPHRGFETCTLVLEGKVAHKDSVGNEGMIGPGGVQWMTAGRGIVHSEFPAMVDGQLHGFQLWINLPKKYKMVKPRYQDLSATDIPTVEPAPGVFVRLMAGEIAGTTGPIKMINPGQLTDVRLSPGGKWDHPVPQGWSGFAYVYEGEGQLGGMAAQEQHAYVMGEGGDALAIEAAKDSPLKLLLCAGRPIKEPIVQYGPFVMNSELEIQQAFADYQSGALQNPSDNPWVDEDVDDA